MPKTITNRAFTELPALPTGICDRMDTLHVFGHSHITTMAVVMPFMKIKSMCHLHSFESYILMQSLWA